MEAPSKTFTVPLVRHGKSLGVNVPVEEREALGLEKGDFLEVTIRKMKLVPAGMKG